MSYSKQHAVLAFVNEIEKTAVSHSVGAPLTAAALGGLWFGKNKWDEARERGEGVGDAALSALKGGLKGAVGGGLVGGAISKLSPMVERNLSQFGQAQLHGYTGWTPKNMTYEQAMAHMDLGTHGVAGDVARYKDELAKAIEEKAKHVGDPSGPVSVLKRHLLDRKIGSLPEQITSTTEELNKRLSNPHVAKATDWQLTSLPGYLKAMKEHGVLPVAKASLNEAWHSAPGLWKAPLIAGSVMPLYYGISGPVPEDSSRAEEVAKGVGRAVANPFGFGLPMQAANAVGDASGYIAGSVGKGVDYLMNRGLAS